MKYLTSSISDYLRQFLIAPNIFLNLPNLKSNIYEKDWSKFDQPNFALDYFSVDCDQTLPIDKSDIDKFFKQAQPWITFGIQKSISIKNQYLSNFIKTGI